MSDSNLSHEMQYKPVTLTPQQFETEVEILLNKLGSGKLAEFRTGRLERLQGADGEYEIDVTVRFEALGSNYLVLVECKHHKTPIKRDVVQVLYDRLRATGAQKGMIFATAGFQKGAINYARRHGISLVQISDGKTSYFTKGDGLYPVGLPLYIGWLITLNDEGNESYSLIDKDNPQDIFA